MVKNLPPVQKSQEHWVWSLDWEDPLEEKMATHPSKFVWRIPWTRSLAGYSPQGSQRVRHNWVTEHSTQHTEYRELPWWLSDEESACQCRRHKRCGFDPWIGKILWRRKFPPTPTFLPGKYCVMDRGAWWATVHGVAKELRVTERLNNCNGV